MSLQNLSNIRTLVVKVGSSLVTAGGKGIDQAALDRWAAQIAELGKQGVQTVLVSSGAIAEGIKRLGWSKRPTAINELQAAAAVGQTGIAQAYEAAFAPHGIRTAQILHRYTIINAVAVKPPADTDPQQAVRHFKTVRGVLSVEPDRVMQLHPQQ